MHESECTRNCWIFGAIAGLVVMLFVAGIGDRPWIAGLFLGFVTFVLFGGLLIWLVCEGKPAAYDVNAGLKPAPASPPVVPRARLAEDVPTQTPEPAVAVPAKAAPVAAVPVAAPVAAPIASGTGAAIKPKAAPRKKVVRDDLKQIVGIGPKIEKALNALGVTSFAQVAAWTSADVADISERLGRLGGRVESEDWVGQARALDEAGHG